MHIASVKLEAERNERLSEKKVFVLHCDSNINEESNIDKF